MELTKICTQKVISCLPHETILHVAQRMRDHAVGAVIILEGGRPVGIITDRDIVVAVVAAKKDPAAVPCAEIMSADPFTVYSGQGPAEALRLMADKHVRRLPVINEDGLCIGIITLDDCLVLLGREMNDCTRVILYERDKASAVR